MTTEQDNGLVNYLSRHPFVSTLTILEGAILKKGANIYAKIDHAAGALTVSETMCPCTILIFGHPKNGTPLMLLNPVIGLDLPVKLLVWQDPRERTWVTATDTTHLAQRHGIDRRHMETLSAFLDVLIAEIS